MQKQVAELQSLLEHEDEGDSSGEDDNDTTGGGIPRPDAVPVSVSV